MIDIKLIKKIQSWLNSNTGVVSVVIFFVTVFTAWITGVFKSVIKRSKFSIRVIPKMTFGSVFCTGKQYTPPLSGTAYPLHKTAFAIYLEITNIGTADSKLGKIKIGYYRNNGKNSFFQRRLWITQSIILDDFSIPAGDEKSLGIGHLKQAMLDLMPPKHFIEVGNSVIGVAYFEQSAAWGNYSPRIDNDNNSVIKIVVADVYKHKYTKRVKVGMIPIWKALVFNPAFGRSEKLFCSGRKISDFKSKEIQENNGGIIDRDN